MRGPCGPRIEDWERRVRIDGVGSVYLWEFSAAVAWTYKRILVSASMIKIILREKHYVRAILRREKWRVYIGASPAPAQPPKVRDEAQRSVWNGVRRRRPIGML